MARKPTDPSWGSRLLEVLHQWGWTRADAQRYLGLGSNPQTGKATLSRLATGKGALERIVQVCREFEMAPSAGVLTSRQTRLLRALENLRRALELRNKHQSPKPMHVIEDALDAFVLQVENDVAAAVERHLAHVAGEGDGLVVPLFRRRK